ncbi:negative regulator of flagellin synthesis FlgM [Natronocella acetinitrilica]|uniref:Negative regulator of flagellin synthesis n=1 Tax=Natronocella acetinitrilica TaxID=414046 RepID=A0AAE3G748_9GAMM|nr:flagellar biosynthesis anti-sigma factor FlgM [Natronocella acetinitrilica]MCP1675628.1 negative regulator of flagellin synthesis FlgM [Natronocella acetinitrilica]
MTNPINGGNQGVDRALAESLRNRQTSEVTNRPGSQATGDNAGSASAELTANQSERLQAIGAAIGQTPDVDMARVEAIRQSIADGNYPIDADAIAGRFIELEGLLER